MATVAKYARANVSTNLRMNGAGAHTLPGYLRLDTPDKVKHVEISRLEFRNDPQV